MTQIFIVFTTDYDEHTHLGAYTSRQLANDAMKVWVDEENRRALDHHSDDIEFRDGTILHESKDKDGELAYRCAHGNGVVVTPIEIDVPCHYPWNKLSQA